MKKTMSRFNYHHGRAPLRTASELAKLLPLPLLSLVEEWGRVTFPGGGPAAPSGMVVVQLAGGGEPHLTGFPARFHWQQWQRVAVPLLKGGQLSGWRGQLIELGDLLVLQNQIVGPGGEESFPAGTLVGFSGWTSESLGALYGCSSSQLELVGGGLAKYLQEVSGLVWQRATEEGW